MPVILTKNLQRKIDRIKLFNDIEEYINTYYKPMPIKALKKVIIHCFMARFNCVPGTSGAFVNKNRSLFNTIANLLLKHPAEQTFSERLMALIKIKGKKPQDIYDKAVITKQHFSKIKNNVNYQPTKGTALALAISLHLNLNETNDLLRRAGYVLSRSIKADLIVEYFINEKLYDVDEINIQLYKHGFTPLTNNREIKETNKDS